MPGSSKTFDFLSIHSSISLSLKLLDIKEKSSFVTMCSFETIHMKVTLLGTGTSTPDPERVQAGILIELENNRILFDIGPGTYYRMNQLGFDLATISSIFITHFHVDHCSDFVMLCQSLWLHGHDNQLNVYGPPFIETWWRGIFDISYPYAKGRLKLEPIILDEREEVHLDGAVVTNVATIHSTIDTCALKLEAEGKTVVYSADTAPSDKIINLAKGADLLIHECNWLDGAHPEGVHTSPSQLADIVEAAQPKKVVLTHLTPEVIEHRDTVIEIVKQRTKAEVVLGEDLMSIVL